MTHLTPNYARMPVTFTHGEGVWLWDDTGSRYLDALSGLAVCSLGHAHPAIAHTLAEQSKRLLHTSNLYHISAQEKLAQTLSHITGLSTGFFCNSGTEANEAAIKLIRIHAHQQGNTHPDIIVMSNAFHGRTLGSLAASDLPKDNFEPMPIGFIRVPFDDIEAVEEAIHLNANVCAIMLEPIQGEGGIRMPAVNYLSKLKQLCDKHQLLLALDEVQTGVGRSGTWYAFMHTNCVPDIVTSAKALGNGIPIAVCMTNNDLASLLLPGTHGSTFGGNPLASHVALTVLDIINKENLCENATIIGNYLLMTLSDALKGCESVIDIRGKGLMIGIEMNMPCQFMQLQALEKGLLINVTAERVIRLLPPLIFTLEHANILVEKLVHLITGK